MKQSEKMKELLAQQLKLNHLRPGNPNPIPQHSLCERQVDAMSKEELIQIISAEDFWFIEDNSVVYICWTKDETIEEATTRHAAEVASMKEWTDSITRVQQLIDAEKLAMKNAKKILDSRYTDPEYIEFLRMQAKMKERGLVE